MTMNRVLLILRILAVVWVMWLYLIPPTLETTLGDTVTCPALRGGEPYSLFSVAEDVYDAADHDINDAAEQGRDISDSRHEIYLDTDHGCDLAREDRLASFNLILAALILSFVIRRTSASGASPVSLLKDRGEVEPDKENN